MKEKVESPPQLYGWKRPHNGMDFWRRARIYRVKSSAGEPTRRLVASVATSSGTRGRFL